MAIKFTGFDIRCVDSNDDIKKVGVWGDGVNVAMMDDLATVVDGLAAQTGLKVVGRNERYTDSAVDVSTVEVPANQALIKGSIIVSRENAGPVYFKGKLPNEVASLNMICQELINGNKTIGGAGITEVKPRVNTGQRFLK